PGEIEAIVAQPASRRWPSGILALVGVVALVGGIWWFASRPAPDAALEQGAGAAGSGAANAELSAGAPPEDRRPTIAVFPFDDMSPGQDQEYFSDGMTEELLNVLANVRELKVTARTSTFALKARPLTAEQIGDTLRVRYLVEGSVRKAGDQLRITAQLIDTSDGAHMWSDQYDRELDDVFAIQTEIAEAIAAALRIPLGLDERRRLVSPTSSTEAYDLYLAGRARMRERGPSVFEAASLFEEAIALDSAWAPAWAGLAESHSVAPYYVAQATQEDWLEHLAAAEAAARRALELDEDNASALVALGSVHRERFRWDAAESAFLDALAVDPDDAEAHQQYAEMLAHVGRLDEALDAARRALSLDRASIRVNVYAWTAASNGRYDEAIRLHTEEIEGNPDALPFHRDNRLYDYFLAGRWPEARAELLATVALRGTPEDVAEFRTMWPRGAPPPPAVAEATEGPAPDISAVIWIHHGRRVRAIEALESLVEGPRPVRGNPLSRLWAPPFEQFLDEPRYQAVLRRFNLEGRRPTRAPMPDGDR
ncbi:MAG TPA: tetratricopeptide repeat protein, partial [Longimicrobiales bacterium]|nr:tetratricopeptide repeat protein [Longimicrobiales bacterium]